MPLDDGFVAVCDPNDPSCGNGDDDDDDDGGDWNYNYPCGENGYAEVPGEGCVAAAATSTAEQAPPPPTCTQLLTTELQSFLQVNDPALLSWDSNLANDLVNEGQSVDIDPRLFASIAQLESNHGNSFRGNNPFGLGPHKRYTTPLLAIAAEGSTLDKYIYTWGETTVSQLYSGNKGVYTGRWHQIMVSPPGYCVGAGCQAAGQTVANTLSSFGAISSVGLTAGNPNNLAFPCPE